MKNRFARLVYLLMAGTVLLGAAGGALGQDYPNRPVRILVGYPPGGAPDFLARTFGALLAEALGQQFVVDNTPGAGGTLAAARVAKAQPDGYTLLSGETGQLEIAPHLFKALPYDTQKDFTPVSLIASAPVLFASTSKSSIRSVKDLVREAKANPGKLSYGSSGIGSFHHLVFEAFNAAAGVKLVHVPYKGAPLALQALLAGEVQAIVSGPGVLEGQRKAGAVNLFAVSSAERFPYTPEAPPVADDIRGFDYSFELGILGPAGLTPEVLGKLSKVIRAATEKQDVQERMKTASLVVSWGNAETYRERIRANIKKYGQVVSAAKIEPN